VFGAEWQIGRTLAILPIITYSAKGKGTWHCTATPSPLIAILGLYYSSCNRKVAIRALLNVDLRCWLAVPDPQTGFHLKGTQGTLYHMYCHCTAIGIATPSRVLQLHHMDCTGCAAKVYCLFCQHANSRSSGRIGFCQLSHSAILPLQWRDCQ
jgi:hypothetical protein